MSENPDLNSAPTATSSSYEWSDRRHPEHLEDLGPLGQFGLSNYDHTVDLGTEQALTETPIVVRYAGYDFNGQVWFEEGRFHCEVWVYRDFVETCSADTLDEIMDAVSERYGYD